MKRKVLIVLYILLFLVVIGVLVGSFYFLNSKINIFDSTIYIVAAFCSLFLAFLLNILLHEVGHIVFAVISGFKVITVNILGLTFTKYGKRWRVSKRKYQDIGGYCMAFLKKTSKPYLRFGAFIGGGLIFSFLLFIFSILCLFLLSNVNPYLYILFSGGAAVHLMIIIINCMPTTANGNKTDGAFLFGLLGKNNSIKVAINSALLEAMMYNGMAVSELPEDLLFDYPVIPDNDSSAIAMFSKQYYYYLELKQYEKAHTAITRIYDVFDEISQVYMPIVAMDIFYDALTYENNISKAKKMLPLVQMVIADNLDIATLRVKMAKELYLDNKIENAILTGRAGLSTKDSYPMSVIADLEECLIKEMLKDAVKKQVELRL